MACDIYPEGICKELRGICTELRGICTELRGICKELRGICKELRGICKEFIPFDYFSFLAGTFFEKFSPFFLHVSILLSNFAIARIYMWSIPHEQRARIYVQARPKYLLRLWAYFLPVPFRIEPRESPFVHVEHSIYNVGCNQDIRRFAFHVFFSPLWWITCKF